MWAAIILAVGVVAAGSYFYRSNKSDKWVKAFVAKNRATLTAMDKGVDENQAVINEIVAKWQVKPTQAVNILAELRQSA